MDTLFYLLTTTQILLGTYLVWQGAQWLGYVRRRLHSDPGFYAPRVALLCPCKGVELGLERNLVALTEFERQSYEIFFILASERDPARSIIERVARSSRVKANIVIAGHPISCGEKVSNLRAAIEQLPEEFEVLVFADSDGRPGKHWLHYLVAPLADSRVGATTTMRWLVPNVANLPTLLLAAWNAPIVTTLGEKARNFCWGGGTAIRRRTFEQCGALDEWKSSVSDDYSLTRALEHSGRSILFIPESLTLSYVETDFEGLLEFTNRQILITRIYSSKMWKAAALTHSLYCLTLVVGGYSILTTLLAGRPAFHLVLLTFLPLLLASIRGVLRLTGATEALPTIRTQVMARAWIHVLLTLIVPFVYVVNFVHSLVTRKMRWRGAIYELISPQQTRIIRN